MVRKLVLAVAAASALMSSNMVLALGMGDINLRSSLNQPLDAEIELLQVRDLSSQEILPALATSDEFGRAGIERVFFLNDLTFTPVVRADGKSVIRVTSSRPVREPFLNFLVEVRWPSGRVLREFTLLLDPPLYEPGPAVSASPVSPPVRQQQPSVQPISPIQIQPPRQRTAASQVAPAEPLYQASAARTASEIRTSQADTLWEIALRHRPQGTSVHQTMLAIQDLNPDAFIDGNINRMRAEQTLSLPDASQATSRSQSEAISQVAAQNSMWQQRRQTPEPEQRQLDARQRDEASAAPQTASNTDALRLVGSGDEQGGGGADAGSRNGAGQLRDELDTAKEELDSVRSEKAEAESRLTDMQAQMDTLQRLLELKDEQLAAMQQSLADAADASVVTTPPAEGLAAQEVTTQEEPLGDALTPADDQAVVSETATPATIDPIERVEADALADEPAVIAEQSAAVEPDVDVAPLTAEQAPAVATEAENAAGKNAIALLQRMMQNQTFLLAGGGLILLLLLLVLMAVARRNARREADMADNFIVRASEDNDAEAQEGNEFNVALADYQEEREPGLDIAEDPLVEADALIAYDKLDQADDVLTSALEREPERTDLRLKLMEVNGLQKDAAGYAAQAAVLRQDGTVEPQVDMLNVRFPAMAAALASAAVSVDEYPELDEDSLQNRSDAVTAEPVKTDKPVEAYDFNGFDVESEPAARQEPMAEETLEDFDLDFDLDESLAQSLAQPDTEKPAAELQEDDFEFEFDFDPEAPRADVSPSPKSDEEEFSLDEDFDLSLTDELDSAQSDKPEPRATSETQLEPLEVEQTVELSDDDLEGFEADLEDSVSETEAHAEADQVEQAEAEAEPILAYKPDLADQEDEEDEFDFLSGTDESATKLDLARAYIDMGDQEGAHDILTEVIEEGNEQQQQEARDMMEQID